MSNRSFLAMEGIVTVEDWPSEISSLFSFIHTTVSFTDFRVISLILFHIVWSFFVIYTMLKSKTASWILFIATCCLLGVTPHMNGVFAFLGFSPSYLTATYQFSFAFWALPMFTNAIICLAHLTYHMIKICTANVDTLRIVHKK